MPRKEETGQFQVRTDIATIHRLDALRIVMHVSRASVINRALLAGLPALELEHHARLRRLYDLGQKTPPEWGAELLDDQSNQRRQMLALGITGEGWRALVESYAERNARRTYGETLEELERAAGITVPEPV
jgi:hypothetical protein